MVRREKKVLMLPAEYRVEEIIFRPLAYQAVPGSDRPCAAHRNSHPDPVNIATKNPLRSTSSSGPLHGWPKLANIAITATNV
jgi:hypothetical protein